MNIIIAAWDDNRLIGVGDKLPWSNKEDMKMFKKLTLNHAVVMGRKTWESLPPSFRPLPQRENIVVSRTLDCKSMPDGAVSHPDLASALEIASLAVEDKSDVFIIGGAQIYKDALDLDLVDKMIITHMYGSHEGDVYFPEFDESKWNVTGFDTDFGFEINEYTKK